MENLTFRDLNLSDSVLKAIDDLGFEEPSSIQAEIIPVLLEGHDAIGQAQTGTGKTLAFGAPIISRLSHDDNGIKVLVLAPTRELAIQVNDELARIAKHTSIRIIPVYGGQPIDRQIKALRRGIDIVVGTPGRIIDHINRHTIDLMNINYLVLDEADEMLNMGFVDDVEEILKHANKERQTMLFSATMPNEIRRLATRYMKKDAKTVSIVKNALTVSQTKQYYYEIKHRDRFESLCRILDVDEPTSAIIFCKTKRGVDELVESMQARGYNVEGMHGDMGQNQRLNTLRKFKEGNLDFLVATDVAARGIDVEDVTHVINYDMPQDIESYVHRIGRTGRAKREGIAYTLVTPREYLTLKQIEKVTKSKIKRKDIPTMDDIFETKYRGMVNKIKDTLSDESYKRFMPFAAELDEEYNLVDVASALMKMIFDKEVSYDYTQNEIGFEEHSRLFLTIGRIDKISPRTLVDFICDNADIDKNEVGDIDLLEKFSFVNVPTQYVEDIIMNCSGKKLSGRRVKIEVAKSKNS